MASPPLINNQYVTVSTSVLLVNTSNLLTSNIIPVVLLSSLNMFGRIMTVRDNDGGSAFNPIFVSTTNDVTYQDGTNLIQINQPYGFVTFSPYTPNLYNMLNTYAFQQPATATNLTNLTVAFLNSLSNISASVVSIRDALYCDGPSLFKSTISSIENIGVGNTVYINNGLEVNKSISTSKLHVKNEAIFYSSVGINTQFPQYNLDIIGTASVKGEIHTSSLMLNNYQYPHREILIGGGVSSGGLNYGILLSNATSLTQSTIPLDIINDIGYNGTLYIAVGRSPLINNTNWLRSDNTITWTKSVSAPYIIGPTFTANSIAWNGTMWVVGGSNSSSPTASFIAYSYDGQSWSPSIQTTPTTNMAVNKIAWNGSIWLAIGSSTTSTTVSYSYNGINWNSLTTLVSGLTSGFIPNDVVWNGSIWCIVGQNAVNNPNSIIAISKNGINWVYNEDPSIVNTDLQLATTLTIAWNGNYFLVSGNQFNTTGSVQGCISISYDGIVWQPVILDGAASALIMNQFTWSGYQWIGVGINDGGNVIVTSSRDGWNWSILYKSNIVPGLSQINIPNLNACIAIRYSDSVVGKIYGRLAVDTLSTIGPAHFNDILTVGTSVPISTPTLAVYPLYNAVGINCNSPNYSLDVKGTIHGTVLNVDTTLNVPTISSGTLTASTLGLFDTNTTLYNVYSSNNSLWYGNQRVLITGPQTSMYVSTNSLLSSITGLGTAGYISTNTADVTGTIVKLANSCNTGYITVAGGTSQGTFSASASNGDSVITNDETKRLILANGPLGYGLVLLSNNVGIAKNNPMYTLDISGNMNVSSIQTNSILTSTLNSFAISSGTLTASTLNSLAISSRTLTTSTMNSFAISTGTLTASTIGLVDINTTLYNVYSSNNSLWYGNQQVLLGGGTAVLLSNLTSTVTGLGTAGYISTNVGDVTGTIVKLANSCNTGYITVAGGTSQGTFSAAASNGDSVITNDPSKRLILANGPLSYGVVLLSNNVGIAKNNPMYTLDISGNMNVSSLQVNTVHSLSISTGTVRASTIGLVDINTTLYNIYSSNNSLWYGNQQVLLGGGTAVLLSNLTSTVTGLGTAGYISTNVGDVTGTIVKLANSCNTGYITVAGGTSQGTFSAAASNGDSVITNDPSKRLILANGPLSYGVVLLSNNVGIAKNNPMYTLDISGNMNVSSLQVNTVHSLSISTGTVRASTIGLVDINTTLYNVYSSNNSLWYGNQQVLLGGGTAVLLSNLTSTVTGLGTAGYISTNVGDVAGTIVKLANSCNTGYITVAGGTSQGTFSAAASNGDSVITNDPSKRLILANGPLGYGVVLLSNNVGIAKNNPMYTLDISGNMNVSSLQVNTVHSLSISTGTVRASTIGLVDINTTLYNIYSSNNSLWYGNQQVLVTGGGGLGSGVVLSNLTSTVTGLGTTGYISTNVGDVTGTIVKLANSCNTGYITVAGGTSQGTFSAAASNGDSVITNDPSKRLILANGPLGYGVVLLSNNVGIAKNNPMYTLDISGNMNVSSLQVNTVQSLSISTGTVRASTIGLVDINTTLYNVYSSNNSLWYGNQQVLLTGGGGLGSGVVLSNLTSTVTGLGTAGYISTNTRDITGTIVKLANSCNTGYITVAGGTSQGTFSAAASNGDSVITNDPSKRLILANGPLGYGVVLLSNNVGIAKNNPMYTLDISGNMNVSSLQVNTVQSLSISTGTVRASTIGLVDINTTLYNVYSSNNSLWYGNQQVLVGGGGSGGGVVVSNLTSTVTGLGTAGYISTNTRDITGTIVKLANSCNTGYITVAGGTSQGTFSAAASNGDSVITNDPSKRLILANGPLSYGLVLLSNNVGIGQNNPMYTLDISGNMNVNQLRLSTMSLTNYSPTTLGLWLAGTSSNAALGSILYSTDGSNWNPNLSGGFAFTTGSPLYDGGGVWGIAGNGSIFVAVGKNGTQTTPVSAIQYSYDGSNWSNALTASGFTPSSSPQGFCVVWGNNLWVAGGNPNSSIDLTTSIQYSSDAINWLPVISGGFTSNCRAIAYSSESNMYVATGRTSATLGSLQYSRDGSNWFNSVSGTGFGNQTANSGYAIAYGGGKWVAGGAILQANIAVTSNFAIQYSTDGSNWIGADSTANSFNTNRGDSIFGLAYNGTNLWVAVGLNLLSGVGIIKTSANGTTWLSNNQNVSGVIKAVSWNGSFFVATGTISPQSNTIQYSTNGINWFGSVSGAFATSTWPQSITYNRLNLSVYNTFAITTNTGSYTSNVLTLNIGNYYTRSINGARGLIQATDPNDGTSKNLLLNPNGGYVGINCNSPNYSLDVNNTINTSHLRLSTMTLTNYSPTTLGLWIAGTACNAELGSILYSTDGSNWNPNVSGGFASNGSGFPPYGGTWGLAGNGSMFVAVGQNGTTLTPTAAIQYSTDGSNWLPANTAVGFTDGSFTRGLCVVWGNNMWVAGGIPNTVLTSNTSIQYSADGINWSNVTSGGFTNQCRAIAYNNASSYQSILYVAAGVGATAAQSLQYSRDGLNWFPSVSGGFGNDGTTAPFAVTYARYGVSYLDKWVAGGCISSSALASNYAIQYSVDGINWLPSGSYPNSFDVNKGDTIMGIAHSIELDLLVAVGFNAVTGAPIIKKSVVGVIWESIPQANFPGFANGSIRAVYWNSPFFIATGTAGSQFQTIQYSTNGTNWFRSSNSAFAATRQPLAVTYNTILSKTYNNNLTIRGNTTIGTTTTPNTFTLTGQENIVNDTLGFNSVVNGPGFLPAQLNIKNQTGVLRIGNYYTPGVMAAGVIQSVDTNLNTDSGRNLLLNPKGGYVGINCNVPAYQLDIYGSINAGGPNGTINALQTITGGNFVTTGYITANGALTVGGLVKVAADIWHRDTYDNLRYYFEPTTAQRVGAFGRTLFSQPGGGFSFTNSNQAQVLSIDNIGNLVTNCNISATTVNTSNVNVPGYSSNLTPIYIAAGVTTTFTSGIGSIMYSYNGTDWFSNSNGGFTPTSGGTGNSLSGTYGVAGNGKMLVAVGQDSNIVNSSAAIQYSYDGINWNRSLVASGFNNGSFARGTCVVWGNNMWLAGGIANTQAGCNTSIQYSYDAINWFPVISGGFTGSTYQIIFTNTSLGGNGYIYMACGISGGGNRSFIQYSRDGLNWINSSRNNYSGTNEVLSIGFNGSMWLAAGNPSGLAATNIVQYSTDGLNWLATTSGIVANDYIDSIAWGSSIWVAVGYNTSTNLPLIKTSPDGMVWTARTTNASLLFSAGLIRTVIFDGTYFTAIGNNPVVVTNRIIRSANGSIWSGAALSANIPSGFLTVAYNNVRASGYSNSLSIYANANIAGDTRIKGDIILGPNTGLTSQSSYSLLNGTTRNYSIVSAGDTSIWNNNGAVITEANSLMLKSQDMYYNANLSLPGAIRYGARIVLQGAVMGPYATTDSISFYTDSSSITRPAMILDTAGGLNVKQLAITGNGISFQTSNGINAPTISLASIWLAGGTQLNTALGSIQYSIDGSNWYPNLTGGFAWGGGTQASGVYGIAGNGLMFVAVGQNGTLTAGSNAIQYSYDGSNWNKALATNSSSPNPTNGSATFLCVVWGNNKWVAGGYATGGVSTTSMNWSIDGINWYDLYTGGFTIKCTSISYTPNSITNYPTYVAVGYTSVATSVVQYSYDGEYWNSAMGGSLPAYYASGYDIVAYGNGRWLIGTTVFNAPVPGTPAGNSTVNAIILYSTNLSSWTAPPLGTAVNVKMRVKSLTYNSTAAKWIAAGVNITFSPSSPFIMTSADNGVTWINPTPAFYNYSAINSIYWNGTTYISVGDTQSPASNTIQYSSDAITWNRILTGGFTGQYGGPIPNSDLGGGFSITYNTFMTNYSTYGTTTPASLNISGSQTISKFIDLNEAIYNSQLLSAQLSIHNTNGIYLQIATYNFAGVLQAERTFSAYPGLYRAIPIYLNPRGGNVGINFPIEIGTSPAYALDVVGTINASVSVRAAGVVLTSDKRLKTNIMPLQNSLSTINQLRGVYYNRLTNLSNREIGFIAQEVESVLPEVIHTATDKEQIKSIAYGNITALLLEGIKELSAKYDALKQEFDSLKSQLNSSK